MPVTADKDIEAHPGDEKLNSIRSYLSLVRNLDFTIDQSMSSYLENELVEARKEDKDLEPSTMHAWLTVSPALLL